ncbi:MAG: hypothetical protein NW224_16290 [Leptolyngbyaceae cyanobacterium bins.302]|nr:hypothetical protein [Leptolyngbyaceae cyanobacterium bins.302]
MPKHQPVSPASMFADAGQSQQVFRFKKQVEDLEAEIATLKASGFSSEEKLELESKIQSLVQELAQSEGVKHIPFEEITRNPLQPRIIFTQTEQQAFTNVLREEGQLDPVLLLELTDGIRLQLQQYAEQGLFELNQALFDIDRPYILFDGERRWRSGPFAGLEKLKAVIMPSQESVNLLEIQSRAASTSIHQKKLHDLELAQVLISQVNHRYPHLKEALDEALDIELPRALNTALTRLKRNGKLTELTTIVTAERNTQLQWLADASLEDSGRAVLDIILSYQQSPANVSRHVFPLLKLPKELKQAAWDSGVEPKKLRVLSQLNTKTLGLPEEKVRKIRMAAIQEAIANNWSVSDITKHVQELLAQHNPNTEQEKPKLPKEVSNLEKTDFSKLAPNELRLCQQLFNRKMKEIQTLLSKES